MANFQQNINQIFSLAGLLYSQTPGAAENAKRKQTEAEHKAIYQTARSEYDVLASQVEPLRLKGDKTNRVQKTDLESQLRTRKAAFEKGKLAYRYQPAPDEDLFKGLQGYESEISQIEAELSKRKTAEQDAIKAERAELRNIKKKQAEADAAIALEQENERLAKSAARTKILEGTPSAYLLEVNKNGK